MRTLRLICVSLLASTCTAYSVPETKRRSFLSDVGIAFSAGVVTSVAAPETAFAEYRLGDPNSVVGREIRSFNALIKEFKNTALDGGLDASKINGISIPFVDFGEQLKNGNVAEVEFMAPSGAEAYVTLKKAVGNVPKKSKKPTPLPEGAFPAGQRIRIGQGYPTGGKNSWSSPDYVIRSVVNFGVPYKFTVPALANFKTT